MYSDSLACEQLDSAFQLTEHLKALHYSYTHPAGSTSDVPVNADFARQLARPPANTSKEIWLYELGRFLIQKTNAIIVALFADSPACSSLTCPEMRASEWQYLCAVHDPPKSCSAIDYCCHTLDWAATTLTSSKMFPSRLGLGSGNTGGGGNDKVLQQQMKEITNIFRRVYRIYAHAWFQHRDMFWRVEAKSGLYVLFKTVCDEYGMIQPENYTIPAEAEGVELELASRSAEPVQAPKVLKRPDDSDEEKVTLPEPAGNHVVALGDTSKRHRHTKSGLPIPVAAPIQEEAEEHEDNSSAAAKELVDEASATKATPGHKASSKPTEDEEDELAPPSGILRSDTVKPIKSTSDDDVDQEEHADVTVVEIEPDLKNEESETNTTADDKPEVPNETEPTAVQIATGSAASDLEDHAAAAKATAATSAEIEDTDTEKPEKEAPTKSESAD
jgi:hypothetical protein